MTTEPRSDSLNHDFKPCFLNHDFKSRASFVQLLGVKPRAEELTLEVHIFESFQSFKNYLIKAQSPVFHVKPTANILKLLSLYMLLRCSHC